MKGLRATKDASNCCAVMKTSHQSVSGEGLLQIVAVEAEAEAQTTQKEEGRRHTSEVIQQRRLRVDIDVQRKHWSVPWPVLIPVLKAVVERGVVQGCLVDERREGRTRANELITLE